MKHISVTSKKQPILAIVSEECQRCFDKKSALFGTSSAGRKCNRKKGCSFL
jgi:hypothetical protein